jgi:hypothetical protein
LIGDSVSQIKPMLPKKMSPDAIGAQAILCWGLLFLFSPLHSFFASLLTGIVSRTGLAHFLFPPFVSVK